MEKEKKYLIDNPTLMAEWNWNKNNELGLDPNKLTLGSHKKTWWKCSKGHEWLATVKNRNSGTKCPFCAGKKVLQGYNDLVTINSDLAKEWNYEKNGNLLPEEFTAGSEKKVWWKCSKGHEWQATIVDRNSGKGCPFCNNGQKTSFPEYAILYYLNKCNIDVMHLYKEKGYELDIYIPSKKVAIEYDGYYWHKNKIEKDLAKNFKCKKNGIKLYRIREGLESLNSSSIDYVVKNVQKELGKIIEKILFKIIGEKVDIDIEKDRIEIENLREYIEKDNSLLSLNPVLASEWNYEKNGKLKPENFTVNSNKKVWWRCIKGHEWEASIANRNKGRGCPFCSGRYTIEGENDLQTISPMLASEWNYEKNDKMKPEKFTGGSNKKVWWKCSKGHEWQATIVDRTSGDGCPYCSGQRVLCGYNDLQTVNPKIASEWNYEKNGKLKPENFTANSGKNVWWRCNEGHEWQASIKNRNKGSGCPYCAGQKVIKGYNDLQAVNPKLASEWNYQKNNGLLPTDVMPNSHHKVWWKCSKGHEWEATIVNRNRGRGCPICYREKRKKKNEKD